MKVGERFLPMHLGGKPVLIPELPAVHAVECQDPLYAMKMKARKLARDHIMQVERELEYIRSSDSETFSDASEPDAGQGCSSGIECVGRGSVGDDLVCADHLILYRILETELRGHVYCNGCLAVLRKIRPSLTAEVVYPQSTKLSRRGSGALKNASTPGFIAARIPSAYGGDSCGEVASDADWGDTGECT